MGVALATWRGMGACLPLAILCTAAEVRAPAARVVHILPRKQAAHQVTRGTRGGSRRAVLLGSRGHGSRRRGKRVDSETTYASTEEVYGRASWAVPSRHSWKPSPR